MSTKETIRVRATRTGYHNECRRRTGDVFTLVPREITVCNIDAGRPELDEQGKPKMRIQTAEQQFSVIWMERVDDTEEEFTTGAQAALTKATDEIASTKAPRRARARA